jgi:Fe-S cluster assembly iron-binding protein IscA
MKITEQAQVELKKALESFDKPGSGIHIYSTQGCCGPSIKMDIATQIGNGETVISLEGIDFFVAGDLLPKLAEVTIEFGSNGFRLTGLEKASNSCCG